MDQKHFSVNEKFFYHFVFWNIRGKNGWICSWKVRHYWKMTQHAVNSRGFPEFWLRTQGHRGWLKSWVPLRCSGSLRWDTPVLSDHFLIFTGSKYRWKALWKEESPLSLSIFFSLYFYIENFKETAKWRSSCDEPSISIIWPQHYNSWLPLVQLHPSTSPDCLKEHSRYHTIHL